MAHSPASIPPNSLGREPVSVDATVLAPDAATQTTLAAIKAKTDNIDVAVSTRTKPSDTQLVDGSAHTQPVSATSLPLPALAATSTKQSDGTQKTQVVDGSGNVQPAGDINARSIKVDASATVQPVSATSLPLPALAATSTKQSDGTQKTQVVDGSGNIQPAGDTSGRAIKVDASATVQPVSATSLPLPTGAATSAAQTTAQTSLGNIDTGTGTDGATPPTIPGTGVRGWLRSCYDTLVLIKNIFPTLLDMNSGNKSASTLRVVLATDQPTNTNKLAVTATSDQTTHGTTDLAADDVIKWAGTSLSAPTATAPDGSQTAPVFRGLNRKFTTIETTTPLAGAATFTGNWHDSTLTGDSYVVATSLASHVGATYVIEESDDTNNASFTRTVASWGGAPAANTLSWMIGVLRTRWWRVRYVNGATLQTTFELTTCAQSMCPDTVLTNSASGVALNQAKPVVILAPGGAGALTDNAGLFMQLSTVNAAGGGPWDCLLRMHGGKFSGSASATKSGASAARTPTIYKQATATASGNTALWTPASGNKFRVLKFKIQLTADAATSGGARITIGLQDATTDIGVSHVVFVPSAGATALNAGYDSGWIDLGQFGYQSTAANAVLNTNLSAALTAGQCNVIVAGTEE